MSTGWKLFRIGVEIRRRGNVFVVARDGVEAIRVAELELDADHLGEAEEPEFDHPLEITASAKELAHISHHAWAGPPYLADGAPDELDVDMDKLAAAFEALEDDRLPGTRAYQEDLEAQGQLRLDVGGVA